MFKAKNWFTLLFFSLFFSIVESKQAGNHHANKPTMEEKLLKKSPAYLQKVATILRLLYYQPSELQNKRSRAKKREPEEIIVEAIAEENHSLIPIPPKERLAKAHQKVLKIFDRNKDRPDQTLGIYRDIVKILKKESKKEYRFPLFGDNTDREFPDNLL